MNHPYQLPKSLPAGDWREQAACRGQDQSLWFPVKLRGRNGEHKYQLRLRFAKRVCDSCPVRRQCLDDAIRHGDEFGIWGGLTDRERAARQRAVVPVPADMTHGSESSYQKHLKLGTVPCTECRRAHARVVDARRRARRR